MSFFAPTGGSAVKFQNPGDSFTGVVSGQLTERQATDPKTKMPRTTLKGQPQMEVLIPLKDSMGNEKTLYANAWRMKRAISDAMVAAGASDIELGGTLTITLTGKEQGDGAMPANTWSAQYQQPGVAPAVDLNKAPAQQGYADPNAAYAQQQGQPTYGQQPAYVQPQQGQPAYNPAMQGQMMQGQPQGQPAFGSQEAMNQYGQTQQGYAQQYSAPAPY